jgi:predicted PurR-regulated permease PerM
VSASVPSRTSSFTAAILAIAVLYLGRDVLIPFALALLSSFLLAPAVKTLQQWRLPRAPAVLVTGFVSFALVSVIVWLLATQTLGLAASLPVYKTNIQTKIRSMGHGHGLGLERFTSTIQDLTNEVSKLLPPKLDKRKLIPVEVVEAPDNVFQIVGAALIPLLRPIGKLAVVIVFVVFMLLKREDLKDRLFRMMGSRHLHVTMEALDEAGSRVSRYLLMQMLTNGSMGIAIAAGLLLIGLPHALLWGFLFAVLRFIPYLGSWAAAGLPIALSVAVFDSWIPTILVIALFAILELVTNNVIEPWLYGAHTGVSSFALIVAAVFWTALWGPAGLLLATPLTVCLVVLGRHVPQLQFLNILLGDEPGLDPKMQFYQRLVAGNREEADEIVDGFLKHEDLAGLYDGLLVPALVFAERDMIEGSFGPERHALLLESVREIAEECADRMDMKKGDGACPGDPAMKVLCVPARTGPDEVSSVLFARLSATVAGVQASRLGVTSTLAEKRAQMTEIDPDLVIVCSLSPSAVSKARHALAQIRASVQDIVVVVGLWMTREGLENARERLESAGKRDLVLVRTLREGLTHVERTRQSNAAEVEVRLG